MGVLAGLQDLPRLGEPLPFYELHQEKHCPRTTWTLMKVCVQCRYLGPGRGVVSLLQPVSSLEIGPRSSESVQRQHIRSSTGVGWHSTHSCAVTNGGLGGRGGGWFQGLCWPFVFQRWTQAIQEQLASHLQTHLF